MATDKPKSTLSYQSKPAARNEGDYYFPDKVKDFQAPIILLAAGIVIQFVSGWLQSCCGGSPVPTALLPALAHLGLGLILSTVGTLLALLIATRLRGIELGPFWTAILKLTAISVAPAAAMTLLGFFLVHIPLGGLVTWVLGFSFYFALLGFFFDLDQSETWYCIIAIFLVNFALYFAATYTPLGKLL